MMPILSTMIYCLEQDRVLLMQRHKEPNIGLWSAPGGKVEPGESPYECALRELREETGLQARRLYFRGLVTEVSPLPDYQWMLFLYVATDFSGQLTGDPREGVFQWWPMAEIDRLPTPQADKVFFPRIVDIGSPFYAAKYVYDPHLNLTDVVEYPV